MNTKLKLGFAMCGSFCTHRESLTVMRDLSTDHEIIPILSYMAAETDTRFGSAALLCENITGICGNFPVKTIAEAEKFGPSSPLDVLLICPCTGNTLAKIASGITDTPVTMAAKAHLRCDRPLLIALASNDALSGNFMNIGALLNRKNIYFVPMKQDDPHSKPHSLVADFTKCRNCLNELWFGRQCRPVFI